MTTIKQYQIAITISSFALMVTTANTLRLRSQVRAVLATAETAQAQTVATQEIARDAQEQCRKAQAMLKEAIGQRDFYYSLVSMREAETKLKEQ